MRYRFIEAHRPMWRLYLMCRALQVSKAGYFRWRHRQQSPRAKEDSALKEKITDIHHRSRQTYGSPRITQTLRQQGRPISRRRVARLMRESGLRSVHKPRFVVTTKSDHAFPIAENTLQRDFNAGAINKRLVTDITYIATNEGWLYLAAVMDLGSRKIIGWAMDRLMDTALIISALTMARQTRSTIAGALHHSDRGSQYASDAYRRCLQGQGLIASMSGAGCCYDNAAMESFFHTLKVELVHRHRFDTREQARQDIFEYIAVFYNRVRLHSALGYQSPETYERQLTAVS
jgi:transposase InsO family protein